MVVTPLVGLALLARPMTPSDTFVLSRADFEALLARSERALRSKKRRLKTAPTAALEQEVDLLARQVKQMRFMDRFYLTSLRTGPRTGVIVEDALSAAERHVVEQMSKHPSRRRRVDA